MSRFRPRITYANVVATVALCLAVGGGTVYAASTLGKNAVKSKNIASHAVKARNLAKNSVKSAALASNAVTAAKIKAGTITPGKLKAASLGRANLAAGTLAGLQVAEFQAASVPGLTTEVTGGTPVPLTGTGSVTPVAGKSYELLLEMRGTPTPVGGAGSEFCSAFVSILDNGLPLTGTGISASTGGTPPFNAEPIGTAITPLGLQATGQPQTLTAVAFGDAGCSPATTASLRGVIIELG